MDTAENDTLLNRDDYEDKQAPQSTGCKWERWLPFYWGFWSYHFGTDLLIASWCFVGASIIWFVLELEVILDEDKVHRFYVAFSHDCTLACTILFLIGSVYFVYLSYPEEMAKMIYILSHEDATKLSFMERYFTGSDFLIGSWFFVIASAPFLVYGVYATIVDPSSWVGWTYLVASAIMFFVLGIWVYASFPENMQKNNGAGSTYFYDNYFSKCCCGMDAMMEKYCKTDMLLGLWFFLILTALFMPPVIITCIYYPTYGSSWLDLIMMTLWLVGTALMTYSSYENNMNSSICWSFFGCSPNKVKDDL
mmetsp:Transcript_6040/g.7423  ORF Transcript_6040/g.7423 Transcript_6040/m.7423 type:complete len:307 (-) Transcript_6040:59-979(-)